MNLRVSLCTLIMLIFLNGCSTQSNYPSSDISVEGKTKISGALLKQHERWKGTPYQFGGDSPEGIDCSAFTQRTYQDLFRIRLPRTTEGQAFFGESIHVSSLRAGDLVLFRTGGVKQRHVGIYVEDGIFLHASTRQGVTLSRLNNPYWQSAYWKAIRPSDMAMLQKHD